MVYKKKLAKWKTLSIKLSLNFDNKYTYLYVYIYGIPLLRDMLQN